MTRTRSAIAMLALICALALPVSARADLIIEGHPRGPRPIPPRRVPTSTPAPTSSAAPSSPLAPNAPTQPPSPLLTPGVVGAGVVVVVLAAGALGGLIVLRRRGRSGGAG